MRKIAKFEKGSLSQFKDGCARPDNEQIFEGIKLPHRATTGKITFFLILF